MTYKRRTLYITANSEERRNFTSTSIGEERWEIEARVLRGEADTMRLETGSSPREVVPAAVVVVAVLICYTVLADDSDMLASLRIIFLTGKNFEENPYNATLSSALHCAKLLTTKSFLHKIDAGISQIVYEKEVLHINHGFGLQGTIKLILLQKL
ncbi:hypothetical protein V8G54_027371 [Vigna mungo]|uniref:Uncharacterized protein n=1 Tax=Vigna mungo TaxID=3915 RepID=A0AAQ3N234_VIGMU